MLFKEEGQRDAGRKQAARNVKSRGAEGPELADELHLPPPSLQVPVAPIRPSMATCQAQSLCRPHDGKPAAKTCGTR